MHNSLLAVLVGEGQLLLTFLLLGACAMAQPPDGQDTWEDDGGAIPPSSQEWEGGL